MSNRTDKWRVPPRRVGKVEPLTADWVDVFEESAVGIALAIAAVVIVLTAYVWATDWFVGHIYG